MPIIKKHITMLVLVLLNYSCMYTGKANAQMSHNETCILSLRSPAVARSSKLASEKLNEDYQYHDAKFETERCRLNSF